MAFWISAQSVPNENLKPLLAVVHQCFLSFLICIIYILNKATANQTNQTIKCRLFCLRRGLKPHQVFEEHHSRWHCRDCSSMTRIISFSSLAESEKFFDPIMFLRNVMNGFEQVAAKKSCCCCLSNFGKPSSSDNPLSKPLYWSSLSLYLSLYVCLCLSVSLSYLCLCLFLSLSLSICQSVSLVF